jgi:NAD(P)-dependent dehydrogenase (short-subunit alcohol dehydrogenase family)
MPRSRRPANMSTVTKTQRALVTGSNGGLGVAIVGRLRADGFDVVTLDVSEPADHVVDLLGDDLPDLPDIDVCVSNAGIVDILSPAHRMSRQKWQLDLDVNLTGSFRVVQACLGGMRERGYGRIVVMSSVAAALGAPGQVAYSASKAGLVGMVRTVAAESLARGITANAVLPGLIATPKVRAMPPEVVERIAPHTMPMGRPGEPSEVAALVAYLASEEAGYITGQAIGIDGGMTLGHTSLGGPGRDA